MTADNNEPKVTKEERIVDYIKSIASIDEALEPFKEQKKARQGRNKDGYESL